MEEDVIGVGLQETQQGLPHPVGRPICSKERIGGRGDNKDRLREGLGTLRDEGRPHVGHPPKV